MFKRLFRWAYFQGSIFLERLIIGRNFAFQNGLGSTIKLLAQTVHGLIFGRAFYRKDFLRLRFGGLIFGRAYFFLFYSFIYSSIFLAEGGGGGAYYRNFAGIPKAKTNYGIFNIRFQGAKVWNNIRDDIKLLPLKSFKDSY